MQRRAWLVGVLLLSGCASSPPSRLHTLGSPSGSGDIRFEVENRTSVIVNGLFLAQSEKIRRAGREALEPGTAESAAAWGEDLLPRSGLERGGRIRVPISAPGRFDVRALDRDGRWQHIAGLRLEAGGRYVLELQDTGWRVPR